MARPVILCSGQWTDLPLEALAQKAADWGYQGFELAAGGDHCELQLALGDDDYCQKKLDLLARHDLQAPVLNAQHIGRPLCDPIDDRHRALLPDYVWGDGEPDGVRQRAAEELSAAVRVAHKFGAGVLCTACGSRFGLPGSPAAERAWYDQAWGDFAARLTPILDACRDARVRLALEVAPGQMTFDLCTADLALSALDGREEVGFAFNPAPLHWQGLDPVEFVRRFGERIFHVHLTDVAVQLNGRTSLLASHLPDGDPRRGWDYRSPGHGGIDWEGVLRALNSVGYESPLSVVWRDAGMQREWGAEDACKFVKRLDFDAAPPAADDGMFG